MDGPHARALERPRDTPGAVGVRSPRREQAEALAGGGGTQSLVGTHEVVPGRMIRDRDERRAELHRVGGAKGVRGDEPQRTLPHGPRRRYFGPRGSQLPQRRLRSRPLRIRQAPLPAAPLDR